MTGRTKRFTRLTGASLALVVALGMAAGPMSASDDDGPGGFKECAIEAAEAFVDCAEGTIGFWGMVGCTIQLVGSGVECAAAPVIS